MYLGARVWYIAMGVTCYKFLGVVVIFYNIAFMPACFTAATLNFWFSKPKKHGGVVTG